MRRKIELRKLIETHNRRLQKLKEQQASYGLSTEPAILLEIENIEAEIEKLQAELTKLEDILKPTFPAQKIPISSKTRKVSTRAKINPFIFGSPVLPSSFVGREYLIDNFYNRLAGPVRTSVALSGETGSGKTSFAHYLIHVARQEQWGQPYTHNIFVYHDCRIIDEFTPKRFWYHILESIKYTEDGSTLDQEIDLFLDQSEINAGHIQRFLRWLNKKQCSLVLILDEFEHIVESQTTNRHILLDFLSSLRALTNLPDCTLTLLTFTREPLNVIVSDTVRDLPGSYFYNNFAFETLPPLTSNETDMFLERVLEDVEFKFDNTDRDFLQRVAGCHPALLQIYCHYLFEIRRQGVGGSSVYKIVLQQSERSAQHYFDRFWYGSSHQSRAILILLLVLSMLAKLELNSNLSASEIERSLEQYWGELSRLIELGLVKNINDNYSVFSTTFSWWIIGQISKDKTEYPKLSNENTLNKAKSVLEQLIPQLELNEYAEIVFTQLQK